MESADGDIQPVTYDELANHLLMEGSDRSPSYVHGGICGIFAGAGAVDAEDCLSKAAQALELALQGESAESCLMLAATTLSALLDENFTFHLLLPDEDVDIGQRVQALAEWCRGFLAAYALVMSETAAGLDSESGESLSDIAAIAEATVDVEADEEESERHLFEVSEYLRFATLNLFMHRQDADEAEPAGAAPDDGS